MGRRDDVSNTTTDRFSGSFCAWPKTHIPYNVYRVDGDLKLHKIHSVVSIVADTGSVKIYVDIVS